MVLHPDLGEPRPGDRADAPHQIDRQIVKECELGLGIDDDQPVWLGDLRGDLRQVLGARHAHRDRQSEFRSYALPYRPGDLRRRAEEVRAARHVGERLVDGDPLDQRCEVAHHLDGGVAEPLVFLEVTADENEVGAKLARPPARHPAAHPECLRFIGGGENDAATDGDGLATQGWVEQLLDRRVKSIEVGMEDGGRRIHPGTSTAHPLRRIGSSAAV